MKPYLLLCFSLILTNVVVAQCDCSIPPFSPDSCRKKCFGLFLQRSDTLEMSLIIGLNTKIADKVFEIRKTRRINNIDSIKSYFSKEDFNTLSRSLEKLNKAQVNYLNTPLDKRKDILAQWQEMNLNRRPG